MQRYCLQKSIGLILLLLLLHALAAVVIFQLHFMVSLKLGLLVFVLFSLFSNMRHALLLMPNSIHTLAFYKDRIWCVQSRARGIVAITILPRSIVTRYFLLLYGVPIVPAAKAIKPIVICWGSLPARQQREIRRLLK